MQQVADQLASGELTKAPSNLHTPPSAGQTSAAVFKCLNEPIMGEICLFLCNVWRSPSMCSRHRARLANLLSGRKYWSSDEGW